MLVSINLNTSVNFLQIQVRNYSPEIVKPKLSKKEIEERVLKVCSSYDKVTADKVFMYFVFVFTETRIATRAMLQCQATSYSKTYL